MFHILLLLFDSTQQNFQITLYNHFFSVFGFVSFMPGHWLLLHTLSWTPPGLYLYVVWGSCSTCWRSSRWHSCPSPWSSLLSHNFLTFHLLLLSTLLLLLQPHLPFIFLPSFRFNLLVIYSFIVLHILNSLLTTIQFLLLYHHLLDIFSALHCLVVWLPLAGVDTLMTSCHMKRLRLHSLTIILTV